MREDADAVDVRLTAHEAVILSNALNESREAIEAWETQTRMGATAAEVEDLRRKIAALQDAVRAS